MSEGQAHSRTILLVDDSERIRTLVRAILGDLSYDVFEAGNAEEAIEWVSGAPGRVDLLITDYQMPGASGLQLAEDVRRTHPDVKVLCMSGYGFPQSPVPGVRFIQKPFRPDVLLECVRELLGG